jgi:hypothetical protein
VRVCPSLAMPLIVTDTICVMSTTLSAMVWLVEAGTPSELVAVTVRVVEVSSPPVIVSPVN